jgi:hypothetical protein
MSMGSMGYGCPWDSWGFHGIYYGFYGIKNGRPE